MTGYDDVPVGGNAGISENKQQMKYICNSAAYKISSLFFDILKIGEKKSSFAL